MRKLLGTLLLSFAAMLGAQIPAPQINLSGNIGCQGFPCVNNGTLILASDANHTMTAQETSAFYLKVTSSVSLTATRNLIAPAGRFPFTIENLTTGGQAIQIIGASGTGVTIANGTTVGVWNDGTNFVQIGSTTGATIAHTLNVIAGDNAGNGVATGVSYTASGTTHGFTFPASSVPITTTSGNGAFGTDASGNAVTSDNGAAAARVCNATNGICAGGGGSSAGPLGAVQVAAAAGAFAAGVGDTNYESPNSAPLGGNQGGIQDIARADVSGNQFQFSDGTLGLCAGVAYCTPTKQAFAEDVTYTVLMNPSLFTASQVLNFATKFAAAVDAHGVMSAAIDSTGAISLVCSGFDLNCVYTSGPGASMVGLLCYVHYLKTGTVTCYTNNVAALKTSQAYRPINGSSHLPTVVLGANEYVPQSLFLEQARFSGDVANASVLLAAYDAAMLKMATAAGDATNVTFFTTNLSQVTASIQSEFVDGTSHMLFGATGQDAQIDILTSGMAVWFSQYLNSPILTLAQQKAIGTYLHTNLATIAHNGYFINSASSGGAVASWTSQGQIPSGGGAYTNICGSTTTYQNGYWSLVTGMAAQALYLTNPSDVPTLLASFRDSLSSGGGDPAQEYYTQAFGTASGGTCGTASTYNMESPQSAAWAAANLVGPTPVAFGQGGTDKYGAIVTNPPSLANPYTIASGPQAFKTTVSADGVITYENDSVSGYTSNVFKDNAGTARLSIGWGNASSANLNNIDFFYGVGNPICIASTIPGCAEFIDASNNIYFNTTVSTSAGGATAKLATNGALTLDSVTTTGGSTPWAATPFAGSMDTNNGTADGGPWRGYYAANHNLAFNVSNLGVPATCGTAEIIRFVKDDGETGGAVIGGIDNNGLLCGWSGLKLPAGAPITIGGVAVVAPVSNVVTSATGGSGTGTITCATATCTNLRGSYTVAGGTFATGTLLTLVWPTTTTAYVCSGSVLNNATGASIGYHAVATATGMTFSSLTAATGLSIDIDYGCQP